MRVRFKLIANATCDATKTRKNRMTYECYSYVEWCDLERTNSGRAGSSTLSSRSQLIGLRPTFFGLGDQQMIRLENPRHLININHQYKHFKTTLVTSTPFDASFRSGDERAALLFHHSILDYPSWTRRLPNLSPKQILGATKICLVRH